MIEQSILSDKLKSFDYYFNKLPLYLKNSYGFREQFHLWWELLQEETNDADTLLNMLLIFDDHYLNYLYENNLATQNECDILDKLGALFGVTRKFRVNYTYQGEDINRELNLTTEEFLILIKGQIIKNYCEGTRKQIEEYYNSVGLKIYAHTDDSAQATVNLYLAKSVGGTSYDYSQNIIDMFLSGQLIIEQVGIQYRMAELDFDIILFWNDTNDLTDLSKKYWAIIQYSGVNGTISEIKKLTEEDDLSNKGRYKITIDSTYYIMDGIKKGLKVGDSVEVDEEIGFNGGVWIA